MFTTKIPNKTTRVSINQVACHTVVLLGILCFALAGCSGRYSDMSAFWPIPTKDYTNYGPGRFKTSYLVKQIDNYYRGSNPGPIGVTTFVNIDDLYTTSTFGRMLGEQVMSELAMNGFDVIELRHADALQFLDNTGEFALSRDVRAVRPARDLAAVVVGTYVASPDRIYVNARLVDPSTSLVLSAGSVEMSRTSEISKLLRGGSVPQNLERIPVKHLGDNTYPINVFDRQQRSRQWEMEESGGFNYSQPSNPTKLSDPTLPPVADKPEPKVEAEHK